MATLFEQINREDISNRQEIDKRQHLYLPLVDAFCRANDPYELRVQLAGANGVASLGLKNSQGNELPEPFIRCRTGFMEESSRFNYGYDMVINKRKIDVSGQLIPLDVSLISLGTGMSLNADTHLSHLSNSILIKAFRMSSVLIFAINSASLGA